MESSEVSEPLPAGITLAQAVPKGKNMELIIQKATELGAARIVPLLSTNTVIRLDEKERAKKRAKWQRVAVEACKQCGQNWLPLVDLPTSVESFVRECGDPFRVIAAIAPESSPLKVILANRRVADSGSPDAVSLMIGPEGRFHEGGSRLRPGGGICADVAGANHPAKRDRRDLFAQCSRLRVDGSVI